MERRVLVLKAGATASNNLIRSLKAGDPSLYIVGCHSDRFALKQSPADRSYALPVAARHSEDALRRIVERERIGLAVPTSDGDVLALAAIAKRLPCRTFLPRKAMIERCRDKLATARVLEQRGLPIPATFPVATLDDIRLVFRRLARHAQLWCRARAGSGSVGAIPVRKAEQAHAWIRYWEEIRGLPAESFTLSEYLPGRDVTVQCLFRNGTLLMAKMHERLTYHTSGSVPSGVSSTAALARMVHEPGVMRIAAKAVCALDATASGMYFVDMKEDVRGRACITEVNAGRFSNVATIHDGSSPYNMALAYVKAGLGEKVGSRKPQPYREPCYVLRTLDAVPAVFFAADLSRGIERTR